MASNDFDELIETAMAESGGARLLLVLLKVEGAGTGSGGGSLTPVLANDVVVEAGVDLDAVVRQADLVGLPWDLIMAAVLTDPTGRVPSSAAAEPHLKKMADDLMRSGDLSRYAVFDRAGDRLSISRAH
ncbi:hypothetical protein ACTZWW_12200 [Salinarimonas sp. NSM]|uniref:hypothetical protein n=1 Tax=Salinarimonas sp. NSM TaxID=3458003 RepID=UPI004034FBAE